MKQIAEKKSNPKEIKQIAEKKGYKVPAGKVLVLRTASKDGSSTNGFVYPVNGYVEAPDWKPTKECGNGLHGALKGEGDGSLFNWDGDAVWQVIEVSKSEIIDLDGKVKFKDGNVVYTGNRLTATQIIDRFYNSVIIGCTKSCGDRATLTGGDRATLTGGDWATLTGGDRATLTGGDWATLTGGYSATLTGGDWAIVTGGNWATLTGGDRATLTGGYGATLTGGDGATLTGGDGATLTGGDGATLTGSDRATLTGGYRATLTGGNGATLIFKYHDGIRSRYVIGYVGENGIEPNTAYKLNDENEIVKC